jgi:hypothetical protein
MKLIKILLGRRPSRACGPTNYFSTNIHCFKKNYP